MPLLTERVVRLALAQTACWRELGMVVPVAVNVSPTDLVGDELVDLLAEVLRDHGLPPARSRSRSRSESSPTGSRRPNAR